MTPLSRLGLLGAALALPLAAVVVSYVSGADPGPNAPVEVRIGGPGGHPGDAVMPSPEAVRVPVVVEQPAEIRTETETLRPATVARAEPAPATVVETVVSALPPVVVEGGQSTAGKGAAKAKGKTKSGNTPGRGNG